MGMGGCIDYSAGGVDSAPGTDQANTAYLMDSSLAAWGNFLTWNGVMFLQTGDPSFLVDDSAATVVKTWSNVAKDLADTGSKGDDNYSAGVKTDEKNMVKSTAASLLEASDWMVIRAAEGGTAVPSAVATYRAAVRTKSNSMETAIDNASDMAAVIALDTTTYHANGDINVVATLQDWPEVPDALK